MKKYKLALHGDGDGFEVSGVILNMTLGDKPYHFIIHKSLKRGNGYAVSHQETGKHIAELTNFMNACLGDKRAAAKAAIRKLCATHGEDRLLAVLDAAPLLNKEP